MIKKIRKKIRKCECGKIAVGVISVLRGHKYVCQECAEKSGFMLTIVIGGFMIIRLRK